MKSCRTTIWLLLPILLLGGCSKPTCLQNAGALTTVVRQAAPFHRIDLYNDINLVLTQDTVEAIRVETSERLQPNISTTIENGVLTLKNAATCNWLRDPSERVTVYVSVKKLDYVYYGGSGNITSTNTIEADTITFYSNIGAGNVDIHLNARRTDAIIEYESADFIFHGKSDYCYSYANARGSIDFKEFKVKSMLIWYAGVRNATINVTESLQARIFHTGNVYYKGSPVVLSTEYYSTGRILPSK